MARTARYRVVYADYGMNEGVTAVALQSPYTEGFVCPCYNSHADYDLGKIRALVMRTVVVGFTHFEHDPTTGLTFLHGMGVDYRHRRSGLGTMLINDLKAVSRTAVELRVSRCNEPAIGLYRSQDFVVTREDGKHMVMTWKNPGADRPGQPPGPHRSAVSPPAYGVRP